MRRISRPTAPPPACSKGAILAVFGRTKGGLNLQAARGLRRRWQAIDPLLTEGQVSDYRGAATVLPDLPDADVLIADKGYDSNWFREALTDLRIEPASREGPTARRRSLTTKTLQAAQPHRAHVRQAQGLAPHRHPIRPLRPHLHEAQSASPQPLRFPATNDEPRPDVLDAGREHGRRRRARCRGSRSERGRVQRRSERCG